jgi:hypothetical protein
MYQGHKLLAGVQYLLSTHTQDSSCLDYSVDFHYGLNISTVVSGKLSASGFAPSSSVQEL